jgi:hypothetical protein
MHDLLLSARLLVSTFVEVNTRCVGLVLWRSASFVICGCAVTVQEIIITSLPSCGIVTRNCKPGFTSIEQVFCVSTSALGELKMPRGGVPFWQDIISHDEQLNQRIRWASPH